jgi:hypothetical protein
MPARRPSFSRPVYEGLPALYVLGGVGALVLSYALRRGWVGVLLALVGVAGVLGGCVVWLRRRDFRTLRGKYPGGSREI